MTALNRAEEFLIRNSLMAAALAEGEVAGGQVVIVGERANVDAGPFRLPAELQHKETDVDFLLRVGAFHRGPSRQRLRRAGLCWEGALNLLLPDRSGRWEDARADEVASQIRGPLLRRFRWVVLLGRRVALAFQVPGVPLRRHGRLVTFPHPSGRNTFWRDPLNLEMGRSFLLSLDYSLVARPEAQVK